MGRAVQKAAILGVTSNKSTTYLLDRSIEAKQ
jgi:hypothetical protein